MPTTKAQMGLPSSAVEADDINLHSCADFRQKWAPALFCKLPLSERTAILVGMLTSSDPISIVQEGEGYRFATESTSIHEAMPLLHDYSTNNKQIAREACEAFYQNNTFISSSRWLPELLLDQTDTWIVSETIQPHLLYRSLRILLDHYEPQTPASPLVEIVELTILLVCTNLNRLEIEICTPESLAKNPEGLKKWIANKVIALGEAIRHLRERFGTALKVSIGGPHATQEKEDITWMLSTI